MLLPAVALVVAQVVHAVVPIDEDHESESSLGLYVGLALLIASLVGLYRVAQHRPGGERIVAWTGLLVAVGFAAYHAVPWSSALTNPYLGEPVGAPGWISVLVAIAVGLWCASVSWPWSPARPRP